MKSKMDSLKILKFGMDSPINLMMIIFVVTKQCQCQAPSIYLFFNATAKLHMALKCAKTIQLKRTKSSEKSLIFVILTIIISGGCGLAAQPAPAEHLPRPGELSVGHLLPPHHLDVVVIVNNASRVVANQLSRGENLTDDIVCSRSGPHPVPACHPLEVDLINPGQPGEPDAAIVLVSDSGPVPELVSHVHVHAPVLLPPRGDRDSDTHVSGAALRHVRGVELAPETSITSESITQWNEPRRRAGRGSAPDSLDNVLNPKKLIGYASRGRPAAVAGTERRKAENRFCVSIHSSHNLPGGDSRHRNRLLSRVIKLNQMPGGRDTGGKMARRCIGPILAILGAGHGRGRVCTPLGQPGVSKLKTKHWEGGRHDEITIGDGQFVLLRTKEMLLEK